MKSEVIFAKDSGNVHEGSQISFKILTVEKPKEGMEELTEVYEKTLGKLHTYGYWAGVRQTMKGKPLDEKLAEFKKAILQNESITREHLVDLIAGNAVNTSFGNSVTLNNGNSQPVERDDWGGTCR